MLLLVGSWITVTQFSGVSLISIFVNYSASKTLQLESYQIPYTLVYTSITPVLKKLHWLPVEHHSVLKTATLVYKFLHTGFPKYFAPYIYSNSSFYSTRCSQSGVISLSFPSFNPQSINPSKSLVIVLLLMLPLFGMLFLRRFMRPPLWPPSENASNLPLHQGIPSLVLLTPWHSMWCLDSFLSLVIEIG